MSKTRLSIRICRKLKPLFPSEAMYLRARFRLEMGYSLNLKNPKTFSEKIQWLKLYNRCPEYTMMVDKYAVKDFVAQKIGSEYIIPTLGIWDTPEEIEWDKLPNRFVLKTTHGGGSGGVIICHGISKLDKQQVIDKLRASLRQDIAYYSCEWPYKNVPRRIIAEKFIEPNPGENDLPDYKFFCFNGEPKYCQVISGRETTECIDFFDREWIHQPFHEPRWYPFAQLEPQKPEHFDKMWGLAGQLAQGLPFSRIDFYDVRGNVYFGEITFFPTSGFGGFLPNKYDKQFGDMIVLPPVCKSWEG